MPWLKKGIFFVGNISLCATIFFTAADPEVNRHEKCEQLGDGNGKPDTVRSQPQRECYNGDDFKNNGLEKRNHRRNESVVQCREKRRAVHTESVQEEGKGKEPESPDGERR